MLDSCNYINEDLQAIMIGCAEEAVNQGSLRVGTEHLLLSLASQLNTTASQALASMKIDAAIVRKEIEKLNSQKNFINCESSHNELPGNNIILHLYFKSKKARELTFSDQAIKVLATAEDFLHYLGQNEIGTAHVLIALLENKDTCASFILEELSINLAFLKGKTLQLLAAKSFKSEQVINLRSVLASGIKQLVEKHSSALYVVQELMRKSKTTIIIDLPKKEDILRSVCTAYLADCLYNQIAFQRYLLEEALCALSKTIGNLNEEIASQIVSTTAQHLRRQARQGIEYVWTNEYRLIKHMLNDAEYDLIGSVIEDLWWAYSEDVALDKSFTSALADHRKSHLLDLQRRRIELSQRLRKVKNRLEDTIKQCFKNKILS